MNMNIQRINWKRKIRNLDHSYRGREKNKKDKWTLIFHELIGKKRRRRKLGPLLQREGEKKKKKINEHEYSTN